MLTGAERNSLVLTLGFLLLGSGIKVWKQAHSEIGPFAEDAAEAAEAVESRGAGGQGGSVVSAGSPLAASDSVSPPADPGNPSADPSIDPPASAVDAAGSSADADTDAGMGPESLANPLGSGLPGPGKRERAHPERTPKRKPSPAGKVDPNRASETELTAIPGIGPKLAAAIVAHRRERGAFRNLEQLRDVKGIGDKKWAAIAPCLTLAAERSRTPGDTAKAGPEALRP